MHPGDHAAADPDRAAVVMADDGLVVTYGELDERSMRLAQVFRGHGLRPGGHVAILMENNPRYFEVAWAAQRCGLYLTPINWHLKADEVGYILEDCEASAIVTSAAMGDLATELEPHLSGIDLRLMVDGVVDGYDSYEERTAAAPAEPLAEEVEGMVMFYSSGTTGRPKGILPSLPDMAFGEWTPPLMMLLQFMYGVDADSRYLCPAPLYHAAPLQWSTAVQRIGGTVVVMSRFEPLATLELIERHEITHGQFVPTHFVRMLKLPDDQRTAHDLSSLRVAVHAAAPCPVEVKERLMDWWGPIVYEYYAGSEANGFVAAGPEEWLEHKGTVGKALVGAVHIVGEDGRELPVGEDGQIYFESEAVFEYHNDPVKTAEAFDDRGWSTLGDVGHLDDDGYLYLTDRISHMIISGGVNIYPQEVENELTMHPAVSDVAVIGVPDPEMGEQVKAVVVAEGGSVAGPELEAELIAYCRERLANYKCPRSVDFVDELPRLPTGKLLKRRLRDQYRDA